MAAISGDPVRRAAGSRSVLFVHGTPGDGSVWDEVAALAPSGMTCVMVDLPDHAEDAEGTDLAALQRAIVVALEALPPGPVTVVGHSFGALLLSGLLASRAASIDRAVFVGGMDHYPAAMAEGVRAVVALLDANPAARPAVDAGFLEAWAPPASASQGVRERLAAWLLTVPTPRLLRIAARVLEASLSPVPAAWTVPTTVVHARDDGGVSFSIAEALVARLPRARLVALEAGGHFPQLTRTAAVAREVFAC